MTGSAVRPAAALADLPFADQLVRDRAATAPDAPAVRDGAGISWSHADLEARVAALAGHLVAGGVASDEPVAVLVGRSADAVVAMLAVLRAGGAYCPLDLTAPDGRIAAMTAALGVRTAVVDGANAGRLPTSIAALRPDGRPGPAGPGTVPRRLDDLAYVLHTSGSTGRPKSVAMSHRGLSRLIDWQVASGPPGLRTAQFTATAFDVTFQEVLSTLATGGCLVVVPEEVRRDPGALLATIVRERVERLFQPYVALQLLAVAVQRTGTVPESLRHVVTAGERLIITPAIGELFAALPYCRLDNHYGPTEAHLVTSLTLPGDRAIWPAVPAIGLPVDGVRCQVLDDRLRPVPDGDVGELYVGGSGVARGYLNDPARTAERFVPDPAGGPGARLYRTGDLVRACAGGGYDFVGRADGQLKVRGFRVEPAEVESALSSHPRVDAAAVGLREVTDGVSVLVAYLQTDGAVSQRELTDHVRGLLPAYMVPSRHVPVAAMPRTASGKIDGQALALLELPAAPDAPLPAAGPDLTALVTAIWVRVLGHDDFEADDDFFDVGGDSLLATWVAAELGQAVGRPVELSVFLEHSTVEELVGTLSSGAAATDAAAAVSRIITLRPGPSGRSLYLVHPLGGELICYRELARASRAPLRVLGVGWAGEPPAPGSTLSDIAAEHVAQIRVIQPAGRYLLGGWSFGGVLAYEIAQQLTALGAEVEFLGLIDANPVLDPLTGLPIARTPFLGLLDSVLAGLDDPSVTEADLGALTSGPTWVELMGAPVAGGASTTYLRRVLHTARACMDAATRYHPRPYGGRIELFQAAGTDPAQQARLASEIRELAMGGCAVAAIPGDHWGITRPDHVTTAASKLDAALERAGSVTHGS